MQIEPLGESAYILRDLDVEPSVMAYALMLAGMPGLIESVCSMDSVAIYVDPEEFHLSFLDQLQYPPMPQPNRYKIPMVFDGSDLLEISKMVSMEPHQIEELFCSADYTVASIGFLPGFPYMRGLPEPLAFLPRRDTPRICVPKGSIAIAAGQTGIYPKDSPGGWNLLGSTPIEIVDVADGYFPLAPGDIVNFVAITAIDAPKFAGIRLAT